RVRVRDGVGDAQQATRQRGRVLGVAAGAVDAEDTRADTALTPASLAQWALPTRDEGLGHHAIAGLEVDDAFADGHDLAGRAGAASAVSAAVHPRCVRAAAPAPPPRRGRAGSPARRRLPPAVAPGVSAA